MVGPALLVSAGYVDPGNWGTDVAAGHLYGYRLIWVVAAAILAALFLQQLAARVGFATGQDLATLIRRHVRVAMNAYLGIARFCQSLEYNRQRFIGIDKNSAH